MDKEQQEAQGLSRDDLLRMLERGKEAKLSRGGPRDLNQRAKHVVDVVAARSERREPVRLIATFDRDRTLWPRMSAFRPLETHQSETEVHSVRP
jgi:hypothetical protein